MSLFQHSYFELMREALKPNGIVCSQAGSAWFNLSEVVDVATHCRNTFKSYAFAYTSVPSYPSGQIGFVLGSLNVVSWDFIYFYFFYYDKKYS